MTITARRVLAVGGAVLLVALAVVLLQSKSRLAGSNRVLPSSFVVVLSPGQQLCQPALVPGDTGKLGFRIGTYGLPGEPLASTVRAGGREISRGTLAPGWTQGDIAVPVRRIPDTVDAQVCLRDAGGHRIAIAGQGVPPPAAARVNGKLTTAGVRMEFLRPGHETWLSLAPTIAHRMGLARAGFIGAWLPLALIAIVLALAALAARAVLREDRA